MKRGRVKYHKRNLQERDYSGLRFANNITPTDIDGFLEIGDKVFVFIEYKSTGAPPIEYGQNLAFERLVDSSTRPALYIYATHTQPADTAIDGANAIVEKYRYSGAAERGWIKGILGQTVKILIDSFLRTHNLGNYII